MSHKDGKAITDAMHSRMAVLNDQLEIFWAIARMTNAGGGSAASDWASVREIYRNFETKHPGVIEKGPFA